MTAENHPVVRHAVFRSINKPLLFMGVDRRYFFFAVVFGAAVFNLLGSLIGGIGVFCALYAFASSATKTDPQILPIILKPIINPDTFKTLYDPAKYKPSNLVLHRDSRCDITHSVAK